MSASDPLLPFGALPRVDLLPPSEVRRRETAARARTWTYIGFGALLLTLLLVGGTFTYNMAASVRLGVEQARTQQLLVDIAGLSEVSQAVALRTELSRTRSEAMAGDLTWTTVIDTVAQQLPGSVTILDYLLAAGPIPDAASEPSEGVGASGTITVGSVVPLDLVDFTRALRDVESVRVTEVDELSSDEAMLYEYRIRFVVDQSVYTNAFRAEGE